MEQYICKIATIEEMNKKWDYEISIATHYKEKVLELAEKGQEIKESKDLVKKIHSYLNSLISKKIQSI